MKSNTKHIHRIYNVLLTVLFGLVGLCAAATTVAAQEVGLKVSPATEFVSVQAGGRVEHSIAITNSTEKTVSLQTTVVDFQPDNQTGNPILSEGTEFTYFTEETQARLAQPITLFAGQTYSLTLEINPPQDASTQEFPLTVLFSTAPEETFDVATGTAVRSMIGSNLVVLVSDGVNPSSRITGATIESRRLIDSLQKLQFSILVENDSQSAAYASGSAVIKNIFEEEVARIQLLPDTVLAGSTRRARQANEEVEHNLDRFIYDEPLLLGAYTISIELEQEDGEPQIIAQRTTFAFPLLAIVVGLLLWAPFWFTSFDLFSDTNRVKKTED